MEIAKKIIYNQNQELRNHISQIDAFESLSLTIDLNDFEIPNFNLNEAELVKPIEAFLQPIQEFKNKPCLYFFEITDGNRKEIRTAYEKLNFNNKAALKKEDDKLLETNCLYLGKSQKGIIHRMKVHFGYKQTTEKGLQLLHWSKPLEMKLKIHIICFSKTSDFLLPMYEKTLNGELKPLIGYL
ncbi:MAG: hypothetical protein CFE24_15260 [Flavobacterium sp. BFFFF2]|nr:MAG: hypothetical protein CFE24_15260 [Flavobacterium sp. BFFFF2]